MGTSGVSRGLCTGCGHSITAQQAYRAGHSYNSLRIPDRPEGGGVSSTGPQEQKHRITEVGRDPLEVSSESPCSGQDQLQNCVWFPP